MRSFVVANDPKFDLRLLRIRVCWRFRVGPLSGQTPFFEGLYALLSPGTKVVRFVNQGPAYAICGSFAGFWGSGFGGAP